MDDVKSYGPHLEFWLMSQMLSPSTTQVSSSGLVALPYTLHKKLRQQMLCANNLGVVADAHQRCIWLKSEFVTLGLNI